jgi:poly-beta-1,6 N-acetyl-D-glucosamine synthase
MFLHSLYKTENIAPTMHTDYQVFQTNNSSRWRRFKWTTRIFFFIAFFLVGVLVLAVIKNVNPSLPLLEEKASVYEKILQPKAEITFAHSRNKAYQGFKDVLVNSKPAASHAGAGSQTNLIRAAFYTPWKADAKSSLRQFGNKCNTIIPEWFFINPRTYQLDNRLDTASLRLMKEKNLRIIPIISNFRSASDSVRQGYFDAATAHVLLNNTAIRQRFIKSLVDTLNKYGLQGVNIDFEELKEKNNEHLVKFQKELFRALHPQNKLVTIDISPNNEDYDYKALAEYNDYIVLMAYDQHYDESVPGPISDQKWVEAALDQTAKEVPSSKIILGMADYGYDWSDSGRGESISYQDALALAEKYNAVIDYDNDSYNLHFSYVNKEFDEDRNLNVMVKHEVWFTDAGTIYNSLRFSDEYRTAGTVIWLLGSEDKRIWNFYNRDLSNAALQLSPFNYASLREVPTNPDDVVFQGEGELLDIQASPQNGEIKLEVDTAEQIISEQTYEQLPSPFVIRKFGEDTSAANRKIILTFDDGPDPRWTPKVLDILEKEHIPATFFIVGIQGEKNIPILRRIYKDGFEIGNHTFTHSNIADMSADRATLEMKLTRLLIECTTGRSTILFRAPYNADSEPRTYQELLPIARGKMHHYYTIGESIDPMDWEPGVSSDSIVSRVARIETEKLGNIILLHDAGGDTRQATIDALPRIIKHFKDKGYHFTTVADLIGKTKDDVMPVLPDGNEKWLIKFNFLMAEATYWGGQLLFSLFLVGIALSIGRMILVGVLAYLQKRKEKKLAISGIAGPVLPTPLVSVIVPAYNEEVNAARTIKSLLDQDYENLEIIFVDDGSSDHTHQVVTEAYGQHEKLRVYTKNNGGKASALNYGINLSDAEFVVCIDADTQLSPDAVTRLMKRFRNKSVGAVAGNVKVGNELNLLTRWQSIEYITSQNFDRRAFDLLNCITVVPGAIGAFRKEAITAAGLFTSDTLAEDCDLTIRLLRCGYTVSNCPEAISYTEAPETFRGFMNQRFRWSFGVMQSFWKHRDACFNPKYKALGMVALPNILIYQMILPILSPLADLILLLSLVAAGFHIVDIGLGGILFYYGIFTLVDVAGAAVAFAFENQNLNKLWWMIPQRLVYRQLMYYVLIRSARKAIKGELQGWGKLNRSGNVKHLVISR